MDNKRLIIGIILIIFISISAVFVSGEVMIKNASEGYSLVYFENTQTDDFEVVIDNSQKNSIDYQLTYFLDDKEIARISETVSPKKKKVIALPAEVSVAADKKATGKLAVKIKWENREEEIRKYFTKS